MNNNFSFGDTVNYFQQQLVVDTIGGEQIATISAGMAAETAAETLQL